MYRGNLALSALFYCMVYSFTCMKYDEGLQQINHDKKFAKFDDLILKNIMNS